MTKIVTETGLEGEELMTLLHISGGGMLDMFANYYARREEPEMTCMEGMRDTIQDMERAGTELMRRYRIKDGDPLGACVLFAAGYSLRCREDEDRDAEERGLYWDEDARQYLPKTEDNECRG